LLKRKERKQLFELPERNLVLLGSFLLSPNRSPIALVLDLVLAVGICQIAAVVSKFDIAKAKWISGRSSA
jgi:hypothetical protein